MGRVERITTNFIHFAIPIQGNGETDDIFTDCIDAEWENGGLSLGSYVIKLYWLMFKCRFYIVVVANLTFRSWKLQ